MIQVQGLAFGRFTAIEPLNRGFSPGHPKMRITVDTERAPSLPDGEVLKRLNEAFPGLARHECRAQQTRVARHEVNSKILLIEDDSSANQAHLLEHLTLEILGALDRRATRLSGVTCAYESPPQRNDVFVECGDPESGAFAALIASEAMNAALGGVALDPIFPDAVRSVRAMRWSAAALWPASRLARTAGISSQRATEALELLAHIDLVEPQQYALNLSGEPHYRFVSDGDRSGGAA